MDTRIAGFLPKAEGTEYGPLMGIRIQLPTAKAPGSSLFVEKESDSQSA
jgi:hypothetical protein